MSPKLLYRIGAGLLAFLAVSHTLGMLRSGSKGPEVDAVVRSMRTLRFEVMGFSRTIYDFYFGLGMLLTLYLAYSAVLAWQLARFAQSSRPAARVLAWPFAVVQVGVVVFSWLYFFTAPLVVSTLIALCAVGAARQLSATRE